MSSKWKGNDSFLFKNSIVFQLLILNICIFIIQNMLYVLLPSFNFIENSFYFSSHQLFEGKFWTLFTYSFLHSYPGIIHILTNLIGLYFLGQAIEPILGKRSFLTLYLSSSVLGALFYLSFHFSPTSSANGLIGASASVSGILAFFCLLKPEERITLLLFFIVPINIKPKWVLRIYAGISILLLFSEEILLTSNIAHSAHLGGILAGFIYYHFFYSDSPTIFKGMNGPMIELPNWFKKQKSNKNKMPYSINFSNTKTNSKNPINNEVNLILDKINRNGFQSLTKEEKATLEKARRFFNR